MLIGMVLKLCFVDIKFMYLLSMEWPIDSYTFAMTLHVSCSTRLVNK